MAITENQTAEIADAIISVWYPSGTWCQQTTMRTLQTTLHDVVTTSNPIAWDKCLNNFIEALIKLKGDLQNSQTSENNL